MFKRLTEWYESMPQQGRFLVVLVVSGGICVLGAYAFRFGITWSSDQSAWGQAGDYVGGLLNPLISFATLIGVWTAVKLQKDELSDTRDVIKEQNKVIAEQGRVMSLQYATTMFFNHIETIERSIEDLAERGVRVSDRTEVKKSGESVLWEFVREFMRAANNTDSTTRGFCMQNAQRLAPLAASVKSASSFVWDTYSDEKTLVRYSTLLSLRIPRVALIALCYSLEHSNDRDLATEIQRSRLLDFLEDENAAECVRKALVP